MAEQESKSNRGKIASSYFSVVVSITLVLFMVGLLGVILLQAQKLSEYVKENIGFSVLIDEEATEAEVLQFENELNQQLYVKTTEYVTQDEAALKLQEDLGEDFVDFLGYNPLKASIDVHMNAEYTNVDSLRWISESINSNPIVYEIHYQENLVSVVNRNIRKVGFGLIAFSGLLLIIAIALINNSIRLSIYSKRQLIRTMRLVGATAGFIRKPFLRKGIAHGLYSGLIASVLLMTIMYYGQMQIPGLFDLNDGLLFAALFGLVILAGITVSWFSTVFAVRKYLRAREERFY